MNTEDNSLGEVFYTKRKEDIKMYKFTALRGENNHIGGSKLASLWLFNEFNEAQIQGRLRALFGEPLFETEDLENAYEYAIKAEDEAGDEFSFCVYQGSSGCAVGGYSNSAKMQQAIEELKELLLATEPTEFLYEGYYMDGGVKVRQGFQNGEVIYEEIELDEDELDEVYDRLYGEDE